MPYLFIVFILVAQCILFLVHFVVYSFLLSVFQISSARGVLILKIIFIILSASFMIASLISSGSYNLWTQLIYTSAVFWLGLLFYLLLASFIYFIISAILVPSALVLSIGKILLLFAILTTSFGILNTRTLRTISITPNLILPENWHGKKAVFISDIHFGQVLGRSAAQDIVKNINELSPDVVFIGGDFYDGTEVDIESVTEPFKNLNAKNGVYFVTGNHEEFESPDKYFAVLEKYGIKVLSDEFITLDGLQIVGVDYKTTIGADNFRKVLNSIKYNRNMPTLLLKHTPLNLDVAQANDIGFQISGHTHRAQMFPLNLVTWLVYKGYDYGLKKYENMGIYVSSGVGTWGPPLKVGSYSEIVLINF